ncbi:hypothetical protein WICPIJ_006264 [Wickerhamomyces pijperi]|uniref:Uncharacterized protein n=1 Tax=Wickerhamomyces pijperi TaxID=599730 RepID=A0A9P8TL80_WICPI|nr:hypothetical protein WICPIJ_006264 [Wickerhamomyces pijperi]
MSLSYAPVNKTVINSIVSEKQPSTTITVTEIKEDNSIEVLSREEQKLKNIELVVVDSVETEEAEDVYGLTSDGFIPSSFAEQLNQFEFDLSLNDDEPLFDSEELKVITKKFLFASPSLKRFFK